MTDTTRRGHCACGQLSITTRGEPLRVSVCHCTECQRRTGSVFGMQARFARASVTTEGTSTAFTRTGDSGGRITFHFCPACGSTVYYEIERVPDAVGVAVGAFADRTFPPPRFSVYEARMHPWVGLPPEVEHHD